MTATTPASRVISTATTCPPWCEGHGAGIRVHSRDLPGVWGKLADGPVLGLALECEEGDHGPGAPRVSVQLSRDGVLVDDGVSLGFAAAEDYAVSILRLVAAGRAAA